ncbi:MAG: helix-turn-helix transcriptional regulator [Sphingomonas sp.]|nr:helix-turn-helix transcriptional regulator [Sphingomonas sp.]
MLARPITADPFRSIVFPNRLRELRRRQGFSKLLPFASAVPDIPYIRLSKIERGEVVARPEEIRRIAAALGLPPASLLVDIDAPGFDLAHWAEPFLDGSAVNPEEERFAVLLGAALRARRTENAALTISAIERDYGLAPVNLSRVENALKPFGRWSTPTQRALFALFGVPDEAALRRQVEAALAAGALDAYLPQIANPEHRHERTRARIAELAAALEGAVPLAAPDAPPPPVGPVRMVPVIGAPLPGGLIAETPATELVEAPAHAGPAAFGLRVSRATLGGGLPAQSTVICDPARFPAPGGLAVLREPGGFRLLAIASGRDGRMIGYSTNPEHEVMLDDCDPSAVAAVVAAVFV